MGAAGQPFDKPAKAAAPIRGTRSRGRTGGRAAGEAWETAYRENAYHGPEDEYDPNWNWAGTMQDLALFYRLGRMLAESGDWPNWYPQDEFRRIRDESCAPAGGC